MIKGETKTGFKYEIDKRSFSDWRVVKLIVKIQNNTDSMETIDAMESLGRIVLGDKNFDKLLKHIEKNNDGFCGIDKVSEELTEIFTTNELKN